MRDVSKEESNEEVQKSPFRSVGLLMQSVAVPVSAAEDPFEAAAPTAGESIRPENAPEGSEDNLQVLYEVEEQREAAVKHFRLSDGSYVAASYYTRQ